MRNFLLFFLFILFFCASCKKADQEEHAPMIDISTPFENQLFAFGDTIHLKGTITDQNMIQSVKISLYDRNKNYEVVPSISYTNVGNHYTLDCQIPINDPSIETGLYFIGITAHDGIYLKKYFIPIQITEMRKIFLGVIYFTPGYGNYNTVVQYVDTTFSDTYKGSSSGDYQASEISSKYDRLFLAGALTGRLYVSNINTPTLQFQWSLPNQSNNTSAWFKNLYFDNNLLYVSTDNSAITGYTIDGTPVKNYLCPNNWKAVKTLDYDGRFFAVVEKQGYTQLEMAQFYSSSSMFLNQQPLTFQPVKMYGMQSRQLLMFGNENSIGKSYIFYFLDNQITTHTVFGSAEIMDVAQVNTNQFLVLTTQGVLLYNSDLSVGISMLSAVTNAKSILYDPINSQYFVIQPYKISAYAYPEGTLKNSITTSTQILNAHLYYNR